MPVTGVCTLMKFVFMNSDTRLGLPIYGWKSKVVLITSLAELALTNCSGDSVDNDLVFLFILGLLCFFYVVNLPGTGDW